jgi:hypothetical protein
MKRALIYAVSVLLGLAFASGVHAKQPTGIGLSTGYNSFWFAPADHELDYERPDDASVATVFTAERGGAGYFRATGSTDIADAAVFNLQVGWDLSESAALFVGPSVRYLGEGAVPGYDGTTFALGLAGSTDFTFTLADGREKETIRFLFAVEGTTRPLTHVESQRKTRGLAIVLGIDVGGVLFGETGEPTEPE